MMEAQDQVKAFHSKMLLCDVIQERELQNQLRKRKQEMERQIEKQWEELEQQRMEEHDEKTRTKLLQEYEKKMLNSKVIKDQLHEFKMNCIKRI
mmetsp:Transcript_17757/g.12689  ORF Transcript_17757/g.12689 Transcript_17757/m.12689 type:complete len:94 (+) Transcript_17757:434-715(+)